MPPRPSSPRETAKASPALARTGQWRSRQAAAAGRAARLAQRAGARNFGRPSGCVGRSDNRVQLAGEGGGVDHDDAGADLGA
jgi:hypothetical protein